MRIVDVDAVKRYEFKGSPSQFIYYYVLGLLFTLRIKC